MANKKKPAVTPSWEGLKLGCIFAPGLTGALLFLFGLVCFATEEIGLGVVCIIMSTPLMIFTIAIAKGMVKEKKRETALAEKIKEAKKVVCPKCGKPVEEEATFCTACGAKLKEKGE